MKVISIITIAAGMMYLYLTIILLKAKYRSHTHWLLAVSSFALMFWTLLAYFTYNAKDLEQLKLLFLISLTGLFIFIPVQTFFIKSLHGKLSFQFILTLAIPGLILMIKNLGWDVTFSDIIMTESGWMFVPASGIWNTIWKIYISAAYGSGIIILAMWHRKTVLHREKKMIKLLIASSSLSLVIALSEYLLFPVFSRYWTVPLTPILFIPWVSGYVLAISKYQFLNITPENVTRQILEAVDELVILMDFDGKPTFFNRRAESYFKNPSWKLHKSNFYLLFNPEETGGSSLISGFSPEPQKRRMVVSLDGAQSHLPMFDIEISKIFDRFDDPLGFLVIGKEVKTVPDFMEKYGLTIREMDIICEIVNGLKTKLIAEKLGISERTVKTHITSIYRKTDAGNRVELLNLVIPGEPG